MLFYVKLSKLFIVNESPQKKTDRGVQGGLDPALHAKVGKGKH